MDLELQLSIAFITYNRAKELIRAIESCYPILNSIEIVIWDNHSDETNHNMMLDYIKSSSVDIRYYYSELNLGVAGGRNAIWRQCRGKYVFFLDDDAVIKTSDLLIKACSLLDKNPKIGALAVDIQEPETGTSLNCKAIRKTNNDLDLIMSYVGAAHLLRKKAFRKDLLYPEKLLFGSEELYASLYLWAKGYEVRIAKKLLVLHLPSKINRYSGKERDLNFIVNQYIIKKLAYPTWMRPIIWCMLRLRLLKNSISYKEGRALIVARYNSKERFFLKTRDVIKLVRLFGIKNII